MLFFWRRQLVHILWSRMISSNLQLDYDIMPFTFADVLILRYLLGDADEFQTVDDFCSINKASDLKWSFKSQIAKFIRRFWYDSYREEEKRWMQNLVAEHGIKDMIR